MKSIILIAPPAAGKGTQSELLVEKYGFAHISTGDMLRDVAEHDVELQEELSSGNLIDDDVVFRLLKKRLLADDCNKGFILDGFPRDVDQAIKYDKFIGKLDVTSSVVIFLDVDRETAYKRIVGRVFCPNCKRVYNELLDDAMPKSLGKCDDCGGLLEKRSDDNEESFSKRYDEYLENTTPLIDYYAEKGILYRIDSDLGKDKVFKVIEDIVGVLND